MNEKVQREVAISMKKILDQQEEEVEKVKAARRSCRKNTIKNLDSLYDLITSGNNNEDSEEAKTEAIPEPSTLVS